MTTIGRVAAVYRYPVKSMQGESPAAVAVGRGGVAGDRGFALVDVESGRVVSAKNPRKWPRLLDHAARLTDDAGGPAGLRITLPDGRVVAGDDPAIDRVLSASLGRAVTLSAAPPAGAAIEVAWPDVLGHPASGTAGVEALPAGSFLDLAPLHLLTTATLGALSAHAPGSRFDPRRFRPNVVIDTGPGVAGFGEDGWVGRVVRLGPSVRLRVAGPALRCVMTTLAQPGLDPDPGVLQAVARANAARAGVYAEVLTGGAIQAGDGVTLE